MIMANLIAISNDRTDPWGSLFARSIIFQCKRKRNRIYTKFLFFSPQIYMLWNILCYNYLLINGITIGMATTFRMERNNSSIIKRMIKDSPKQKISFRSLLILIRLNALTFKNLSKHK